MFGKIMLGLQGFTIRCGKPNLTKYDVKSYLQTPIYACMPVENDDTTNKKHY